MRVLVTGMGGELGTRVAHGEIAWAKLGAMVEGARLACVNATGGWISSSQTTTTTP